MLSDKPKQPPPGTTSVRLGAAFLRPAREQDHYELMRPAITVVNEGGRVVTQQHEQAIGPIAIYRKKSRGDKAPTNVMSQLAGGPPPEMKTSDPKTGQPIELILVWWPQQDAGERETLDE